jgi:hypothetical protein
MEADMVAGEAETRKVVPYLREDDVTAVTLFFEYLRLENEENEDNEFKSFRFFRNTPLCELAS